MHGPHSHHNLTMSLHDNVAHLKLENKQDIQSFIEKSNGYVRLLQIYLKDEQYLEKKERLKNIFHKSDVKRENPSKLFENVTRIDFSGPNERQCIEYKMTSMDVSKLLLANGLDKPIYPIDPYWTTVDGIQSAFGLEGDDSSMIIKIHNNTSIDKRRKRKKIDKDEAIQRGEEEEDVRTNPIEATRQSEEWIDESRPVDDKMTGIEEEEEEDEEKMSKSVGEDDDEEDDEDDDEEDDEDGDEEDDDEEDDREDDNKLARDDDDTRSQRDVVKEEDRESLVDGGNSSPLPFLETETEKYITPMVLAIIGQFVSIKNAQIFFSGFKISSLRQSVKYIQENAKYFSEDVAITPNQMIRDIDTHYAQNSKKTKPHRELRIRNDCFFELKPTLKVFTRLEKTLKTDDVTYEKEMRCINKLVSNNVETEEGNRHPEKDEDKINQILYKQPFFIQNNRKIRYILVKFEEAGMNFTLNFDDGSSFSYLLLKDFIKTVLDEEYDYLLKDVIVDICQHSNGVAGNDLYIARDKLYTPFSDVTDDEMRRLMSWAQHPINTACGHFCVEDSDKESPAKKRKVNRKDCDNFVYRNMAENPFGDKDDGRSWVRIRAQGRSDEF